MTPTLDSGLILCASDDGDEDGDGGGGGDDDGDEDGDGGWFEACLVCFLSNNASSKNLVICETRMQR